MIGKSNTSVAWLVERRASGLSPQWMTSGQRPGDHAWTWNANEAIKFASREEAEAACNSGHIDGSLSVSEHAFIDMSSSFAPTELVRIEGDDIVIRITLGALTHATEHGVLCTFIPQTGNFGAAQITDIAKWREAVVRALRREEENGDTPVHLMLDACLEHALEQGEEGVWVEGVTDDY